jgi:extradiol dioxygenase family protein
LIIGRLVIEIKSIEMSNSYDALDKAAGQLLKYGLTAPGDGYPVDEVGLYLARYGLLMRWPWQALANRLADCAIDLQSVRAQLRLI